MKKEQGIRYYPIILFASVMGFAGVTISFQLAEKLYDIGHLASTIMLIITVLMFIFNGAILIFRLIRYYEDVKRDFTHPVRILSTLFKFIVSTGCYAIEVCPKVNLDITIKIGIHQPMGSVFEQLAFLTYDGLVLELMDRSGETSDRMFLRHADLE